MASADRVMRCGAHDGADGARSPTLRQPPMSIHHPMRGGPDSPQDPRISLRVCEESANRLRPPGAVDEGIEAQFASTVNRRSPALDPQGAVQPGESVANRRLAAAD